jgi:hypothetical protein
MLLFHDGCNYCQTAYAILGKHVTMNIVRMHQDDMSLRGAGQGEGGKEQREDEHRQ